MSATAKPNLRRNNFATNDELSIALASQVADKLRSAIEQRGRALLAVSGGSTPAVFFRALSCEQLDWSKVWITQVDERWVDESSDASNARLIRENLLQKEAATAQFLSMKTGEASPFEAERSASGKLSLFAGGIDVVVLGMGEDGHTASFFPGAQTLAKALDRSGDSLCVAVRPADAPHDRMTLSLPAILGAGKRYLHIVGDSKLAVLERAMESGAIEDMPIRSVLGSGIDIYYADRK